MIETLITLIQLFNLCDWVIALFIAGTAARVEARDGKRSFLAVGLGIFFLGFALIRCGEFVNFVFFREPIIELLKAVPQRYTYQATLLSFGKTLTLLFCWFAVSVERRQRKGILSANVIRNWMTKQFEKLR